MKTLFVLLLMMMAPQAWGAATLPTAPDPVDIRVATAKRTIILNNTTDRNNWMAATDTLCGGVSCGGPTFGDLVYLAPGVTFASSNFQLSRPLGSQTTGATEDYITVMTNPSGSTCPTAGTRATNANTANLAIFASSDGSPAVGVAQDNVKYWRFVCMKFKGFDVINYGYIVTIRANTGAPNTINANYPDHIVFERVIVDPSYDFGAQKGMALDGSNIKVVDSTINALSANNGDSNGLYIPCGRGPFLIDNNDIASNGEPFFIGGGPLSQCAPVTVGYEYEGPGSVTLEHNRSRKYLKWKSDDPTFEPQMDTAGGGTLGAPSGSNLTITGHGRSVGQYIRDVTSGEFRKITAVIDANTVTLTSAFVASPTGHSWRYNSAATIGFKNGGEVKHVKKARIRFNLFDTQYTNGTNGYALTLTPREFGCIQDVEVAYNTFYQTGGGPQITAGEPSSGYLFGPGPCSTVRIYVHDNHHWDPANVTMTSLNSGATYLGFIGMGTDKYGYFYNSAGATISAAAASGASVTVTGTNNGNGNPPFASWMNGLDMIYTTGGRGVITYVDPNTLHVATSQNFPVAAVTPNTPAALNWAIGPTAIVGTKFHVCESWVFQHNAWNSLNPNHIGFLFNSNTATQTVCPNFVWQDNIHYNSKNPSAGTANYGGITSDLSGGTGTAALDLYADSGRVVDHNVFCGPDTLTGTNVRQFYTGNEAGGVGPPANFTGATKNAFHEPNCSGAQTGGSSPVGYANAATGDFTLSGFYATAAHDGLQIGPPIATVNRYAAFAYQGLPFGSGGSLAISGSSGAKGIAGSSGVAAGSGCVRGITAVLDSGC